MPDGSGFYDGLHRRVAHRLSVWAGREPDPDDVDSAIEAANGTLYDKLQSGDSINNVSVFLIRVAQRRAVDMHRQRRHHVSLDPPPDGSELSGDQSILDALAREEEEQARLTDPEVVAANQRRTAVQIVRRLIPQMKLARPQEVIEYLLDALAGGAEEVTPQQIGEALGITSDAARKARDRGLSRLARLAREQGYSTGAISLIPDTLGGGSGDDDDDDVDQALTGN